MTIFEPDPSAKPESLPEEELRVLGRVPLRDDGERVAEHVSGSEVQELRREGVVLEDLGQRRDVDHLLGREREAAGRGHAAVSTKLPQRRVELRVGAGDGGGGLARDRLSG